MPAISKVDPAMVKSEPINNSGRAPVTTYLRRGKNCATPAVVRRVRICERINSADTKVRRRGGHGLGTRADIPLQPVVKTMVRQAVPLQPMEVNGGEISTSSLWRTPCWSTWMPE
ncbi:protein pxr1-like [Limosa lapponica baueri]|uniref:Protein pxr1-like n=1 Tax=Limosa lapponica baueri TaxID=1758121 RepID=A0A2I0UTV6_LIMLA|nr:protein pxr1-like [Limosa lapponica baueri]